VQVWFVTTRMSEFTLEATDAFFIAFFHARMAFRAFQVARKLTPEFCVPFVIFCPWVAHGKAEVTTSSFPTGFITSSEGASKPERFRSRDAFENLAVRCAFESQV